MGTIIGLVIGYVLGTQAGPDEWEEIREAWKTIVASPEVHDLIESGVMIARDLLGRGGEMLAASATGSESGRAGRALHSAA